MNVLPRRVLLLFLSLYLVLPLLFGRAGGSPRQPGTSRQRPPASATSTNTLHLITPGPIDGQIASVTALMLSVTSI